MSFDITVEGGKSKRLLTAGKYCESDIVVTGVGADLPELTNQGTTADLAAGKELIDSDGNVVTGELKEGNFSTTSVALSSLAAGSLIQAVATSAEDKILRTGRTVTITVASSKFGDATAADVAKGKTFTSAAGFKAEGTMEGGGSSGDSVKFVSILNTNVSYLLVNGVQCPAGVPIDVPISTHPNAYSGFVFIALGMSSVTFRYTDIAGNEKTGTQEGLLQFDGCYGVLNDDVPAGTTITFEGSW